MRSKKPIVAALFLFLLNAWIVRELFTIEYLDQMGSIEGAYLGLARWIVENWRDLTWFPLWYGGIPYQNSYPPLLHLTVALVAGTAGISSVLAHHAVTAFLYCLGPVALFLLGRKLSGSLRAGFFAGLIYSLISTSAFLIAGVRTDAGGFWNARRLQALVEYGEGPHVSSMTLLPCALLLMVIAFEKRRPAYWFLAALALASVVLTNWLGGAALAMAVVAWLLSQGDESWLSAWVTIAALGIYSYAIAAPWIPPSTILGTRAHVKYVSVPVSPDLWLWAFAAAVVVAILWWVFRRFRVAKYFRFSLFFAFVTALITLLAEWRGVYLVPQPFRYHLEMEMALALLAAFAADRLLGRLRSPVRAAVVAALLLLCTYPALRYRRHARAMIRPVDIRQTIEYREAYWLDRHLKGLRVMVPGSVEFFLNAFTDTPQYGGGFYQGHINPLHPHLSYQILTGENAGDRDGELAVLALKAVGVEAVVVSGPRSREVFKPFRNPRKFDGLLRELWRDGDDVIYDVGRRSKSLAHVIRRADLPARAPIHGLDLDPIRPYVSALDDPSLPPAEMKWSSRHSAVVSASIEPGQVLSVQISYHPGWSATVAGAPVRLYGDALGQIVVEPGCEGPCTVELVYDGGMEMRVARIVSWGALIGGILFAVFARRRMRT